jgi:hypothetical protein
MRGVICCNGLALPSFIWKVRGAEYSVFLCTVLAFRLFSFFSIVASVKVL